MRKPYSFIAVLAGLGLMLLAGCASVGPATIARDRFDNATAVAESWKRVMLLNIVKIRYGDAPVFLEVTSIINQYALEGELNASPGVYDRVKSTSKTRSRVRIQSSSEKPDDAFIAVKYRGHWFYIDDRDFRSKRMFSFLMFLFTLAETGAPEKAPVITIPTG